MRVEARPGPARIACRPPLAAAVPDASATPARFHVAKFGGTSVGTPERVRRVVELATGAATDGLRRVVVVSAFGGVTDDLLRAAAEAEGRTGTHRATLGAVRERHREALAALAAPEEHERLGARLDAVFDQTGELLDGVALLRECTPRVRAAVASAGERASAPLVAAAFRRAGHAALALDATALIRTDGRFDEATVDAATTRAQVEAAVADLAPDTVAVVTGFVGATADGVTTTLGRSGSDYTATILGGALDAAEVVIWTDVDGVLSADPRVVPEAFTLPRLSYAAAAELAHFGAKVLHPRTMRPLEPAGIPLRIANTLRPEAAGTRVGPADAPGRDGAAAGRVDALTAVRGAALVRVEGAATIPTATLAARTLGALAEAGVEVLLVAQASAAGSVCVAVREGDADAAVARLAAAFEREAERGEVRGVAAERGAAVVAAVGAGLGGAAGLAGRLFATLGRARVNVRAIAQGASDHALSCAVADADAPAALVALHEAFALRRLRAHVAVVGAGTLGRRLLDLLGAQADALRADGLHLRLVAAADSRRLLFDAAGVAPADALDRLAAAPPSDAPLDALAAGLAASRLERVVVVDATPSAVVAARHSDWLGAGVAVVTPNKAVTTQPEAAWQRAQASARGSAARGAAAPYLYDAAVGAGLGVVARLRDLVRTGDRVHRVEGALSGTLSFVMAALHAGVPFSEAVRQARDAGLTEPDPRDDLSGRDAARKLALLAREIGAEADPAAAHVESLVPEGLEDVPLEAFWERLPEADAGWTARLAEGWPLQAVASLDLDEGRPQLAVRVEPVAPDEPLATLRGGEVLVAFHTARYGARPLVLRGPGASAEVTAAVVLADVVRAAEAMR